MNLTETKIDHDGETATLRFPHLAVWLSADADADSAVWGAHTVAEVTAALGYARAVVALAYVLLDATDDDAPAMFADLDDATLSVAGAASVTRRALTNAQARAERILDGEPDAEHAERNAGEVLARRQARERRVRSIGQRVAAIARGRVAVERDVRWQLPEAWWDDLDAAEEVLRRLESEIRSAVIARAAVAQDPEWATHAERSYSAEDVSAYVAPIAEEVDQ